MKLLRTCGEDDVLGDEFVVDDRELRQLYPVHAGHCAVSTSPVKLNIICGVSICRGKKPGHLEKHYHHPLMLYNISQQSAVMLKVVCSFVCLCP